MRAKVKMNGSQIKTDVVMSNLPPLNNMLKLMAYEKYTFLSGKTTVNT